MAFDWKDLDGYEVDMAHAVDAKGVTLLERQADIRRQWRELRRYLLEMGCSGITYAYHRHLFRYYRLRTAELWMPVSIPLRKRSSSG